MRTRAGGTFSRLFPGLEEYALDDSPAVQEALRQVGGPGGLMNPGDADAQNPDAANSPAGYAFFGQFIDHDITFDPTSVLGRSVDPDVTVNVRTPSLELDNIYGAGPRTNPYLYDRESVYDGAPRGPIQLMVDTFKDQDVLRADLPRNSQGTAIISDPRNDENQIVAQLHLAFLLFHNRVIDDLWKRRPGDPQAIFKDAQRLVRWHYQWLILHEFLPHIVGQDLVGEVLTEQVDYNRKPGSTHTGRKFFRSADEPFIPIEFSVGAYRFGHSQVRARYDLNDALKDIPLFRARNGPSDQPSLEGGRRLGKATLQWRRFFDIHGNGGVAPQNSKKIDTVLSGPLFDLPFLPANQDTSLALRNLRRHVDFGIPSGQAVARAMKVPILEDEFPGAFDDLPKILQGRTPLWIYVLKEAQLKNDGKMLAGVGARIVAEVLIGLLEADPHSFVQQDPAWRPVYGQNNDFTIPDLLTLVKAGQ